MGQDGIELFKAKQNGGQVEMGDRGNGSSGGGLFGSGLFGAIGNLISGLIG